MRVIRVGGLRLSRVEDGELFEVSGPVRRVLRRSVKVCDFVTLGTIALDEMSIRGMVTLEAAAIGLVCFELRRDIDLRIVEEPGLEDLVGLQSLAAVLTLLITVIANLRPLLPAIKLGRSAAVSSNRFGLIYIRPREPHLSSFEVGLPRCFSVGTQKIILGLLSDDLINGSPHCTRALSDLTPIRLRLALGFLLSDEQIGVMLLVGVNLLGGNRGLNRFFTIHIYNLKVILGLLLKLGLSELSLFFRLFGRISLVGLFRISLLHLT